MAELTSQIIQEDLPENVKNDLAELDLELSEGDITQKGYEKKRLKLLTPFLKPNNSNSSKTPKDAANKDSKSSKAPPGPNDSRSRYKHRRYYNEKRYHSEVRQEAVQQALAQMQDKAKLA